MGRERSFPPVTRRAGVMGLRARDLLSRLLESAMEVTKARRGLVVAIGQDRACRAHVVAGAWRSRSLAERFGASLGAHPMLDPRPSFVPDLAWSDGFPIGTRGLVEMGPGTAACVLLAAEGRKVGMIYLGGRKRDSRLSAFDVEFLEALGAHAALVLAGFRLRRRIHRLLRVLGDAEAARGDVPAELRRRLAVVVPKEDEAPVDEGQSRAV